MKFHNLVTRIQHGLNRPNEALRNITRRVALSIIGINLSKQTEIQYVELGFFHSKIISKIKLFDSKEIDVSKNEHSLYHNFESRWIIEISNVIVNTETNHVYATTQNRNKIALIKESTEWPTENILASQGKLVLKNLQIIPFAKLGLPNSGFYHWMSEDLPSFLALPSNIPTLNFQKGSKLNAAILSKREDILIKCQKWVLVEKLIFVSRGKDLGYIHPRNLDTLKEYFSSKEDFEINSYERIYISRSRTRRSIPGEEHLESFLRDKGFEIIHAEDFSFFEQRDLIMNARIVMGPHGAGLTHAIWSNNCEVIEIMPLDRINRCFEWQTLLQNKNYSRIYFDPEKNKISEIIAQLEHAIR